MSSAMRTTLLKLSLHSITKFLSVVVSYIIRFKSWFSSKFSSTNCLLLVYIMYDEHTFEMDDKLSFSSVIIWFVSSSLFINISPKDIVFPPFC